MDDKPRNLITCRTEYEPALAAEIGRDAEAHAGFVTLEASVPASPFIFERQRMLQARPVPLAETKPLSPELARCILAQILEEDTLWTTHAWSADPNELSRVHGVEKALIAQCKKQDTGTWKCWRKPEKLAQRNTGKAILLFRSEHALWYAVSDVTQLPDPFPGGIRRMKLDPASPSRSYLKMEEALSYLHIDPQPNETVVDLGAAPGGWSWSFLKRGCAVTAVDNGPMKIEHPDAFGGVLQHVRADGISYTSEDPVDWLVSDMLIPPGQVIGMLRKWIDQKKAKHLVFNVKIPHQDVYAGLAPLKTYLEQTTGNAIQLKQLYHDRREVTGFGTLKA